MGDASVVVHGDTAARAGSTARARRTGPPGRAAEHATGRALPRVTVTIGVVTLITSSIGRDAGACCLQERCDGDAFDVGLSNR